MLAGGLSRYVKGIHYAWVTLAIAIAMRLVSSVERTASGVLVAYLVDPAWRVWLEPQCRWPGLIAAMDLLGSFRAAGWLAGGYVRLASYHGCGGPAV